MQIHSRRFVIAVAAALMLPVAGIAIAQIATADVVFAKGRTSTEISGTIKGNAIRDYVVRASAGQVMDVGLSGSQIVYFNVLPPGSSDEAIFIGQTEGNAFSGTLGQGGAYRIRVYQMRATARRGEAGTFKLAIAVTGAMGGGAGHAGDGNLGGITGTESVQAIDAMTQRGFANVDATELGVARYGIFYHRGSRVCAQLTMAGGKVVDARDIKKHPKCR